MNGNGTQVRRFWAALALCFLLTGCCCTFEGNFPPVKPLKTARSHRFLPPEATCIPPELAEDLRLRIEEGRTAYEDFTPVECWVPDHPFAAADGYEDSRFYAVDFDNDGLEDLFSCTRRGMGAGGMVRWGFHVWGGQEPAYYRDVSMTTPLFIAWEGKNYLLSLFYDPAEGRILETIFKEFPLIS